MGLDGPGWARRAGGGEHAHVCLFGLHQVRDPHWGLGEAHDPKTRRPPREGLLAADRGFGVKGLGGFLAGPLFSAPRL